MATGPAPRVISTIPYGGEKQGLKELRFCEWSPVAITAALYRDPPNLLQNPPLPLPHLPPKPRGSREGRPFFGKLQALEGPLTPLWEGGGSEILGEKPRSPAAFQSESPPPKEGGVPHYLESQHPHSRPKRQHLRTHPVPRNPNVSRSSSFHPQPAVCSPVLAWGAPWLALCGRATPWLVL